MPVSTGGETSVRLLIAGEVEIEGDSAVVTPLEGATPGARAVESGGVPRGSSCANSTTRCSRPCGANA